MNKICEECEKRDKCPDMTPDIKDCHKCNTQPHRMYGRDVGAVLECRKCGSKVTAPTVRETVKEWNSIQEEG